MSNKKKETEAEVEETKAEETTEEAAAEEEAEAVDERDERIAQLEQELAAQKDKYMRLAAEYENYRKRTAKEREQLYSLAKAATVESILPVYDNIELAVKQETQDEQYKQGVLMIARQFDDSLAKLGVSAIPAERGTAFDPELHNAVMHLEDDTLGENCIAAVFQKGFTLENKVIRHAVVQVAN